MKNCLKILCLLSAFLLPANAFASKIVKDSITSRILGCDMPFLVYLPDGFNPEDKTVKYPVLYLLHGLSDDCFAWTRKGTMSEVADRLMRSGESRKMVIVMPQAGTSDVVGTNCGYFNVPNWNYEDFFFKEFMPAVEAKYNVQADREHRALSGLSMGGGGTVSYAQRHTDLFCAAYAMSAWLDEPESPREKYRSDKEFYTHNSMVELSPLRLLRNADEKQAEAWRSVRWFLDCGDDDFLLQCNLDFYMAMREKHIPAELRVRDGWHFWDYWHTALYTMLPFVSRCFGE